MPIADATALPLGCRKLRYLQTTVLWQPRCRVFCAEALSSPCRPDKAPHTGLSGAVSEPGWSEPIANNPSNRYHIDEGTNSKSHRARAGGDRLMLSDTSC